MTGVIMLMALQVEEEGRKRVVTVMYFRMQEERKLFKGGIVWLGLVLYVICRSIYYRWGFAHTCSVAAI